MKAQSQYNKNKIQNKKKNMAMESSLLTKEKKSEDCNLIPIFLKIIFV